MTADSSASNEYTLASTDAERARLARQAAKLAPITERLFRQAGITTGMRVLDVGCGAGDVSALVGELVGPEGEVVGCDRDPQQVEASAARWRDLPQLRFVVAEMTEPPPGPFDAIVGRLMLMYQPDMAASLAAVAKSLAPTGVLAFLETSLNPETEPPTWPPSGPFTSRAGELIRAAFNGTNVQPLAGLRLPSAMRAAGFDPQPPYETGSLLHEGREQAEMQAGLLTSMLPVLEGRGIDVSDFTHDLAERLLAEQDEPRIVAIGPLIGVWARRATN